MKKTFGAIIAVLMVMAMLAMSVSAYTDAYPASGGGAAGELLKGELYGTDPWDNGANTYDLAWDGDVMTFFDPAGVGEVNHVGVKLSEEYILTEIRIHPRDGFLDRFNGATIQGSNDGETWTDVFMSAVPAEVAEYQIIKADAFIAGSNVGYIYYRYANNTIHGDVAEVELYGEVKNKPVEVVEEVAPVAEEAPAAPVEAAPVAVAPVVVTAPQTNDNFVLAVSLMLAAFVAAFVVMRKRVAR